MEGEFYEHQRTGRDEIICAWGIVLMLALVFGGLELLWPYASLKPSRIDVAAVQPAVQWTQAEDTEYTTHSASYLTTSFSMAQRTRR